METNRKNDVICDAYCTEEYQPCLQAELEFEHVADRDQPYIDEVITYYAKSLSTSERAYEFLEKRRIANSEAITKFRLGFCDRTYGLYLNSLGKRKDNLARGALQRAGLLKPSGHEFFRGSVVFPFFDNTSSAIGAYGRRVTPKLKAHSAYYMRWMSKNTLFFNHSALYAEEAVLCKSPLETLTWYCAGFKQALGLMSVDLFSHKHLKALSRSCLKILYIAFGGRSSDQIIAWEIANKLAKVNIACRFIHYPSEMDANSIVQSTADPSDVLGTLLDSSTSFEAKS